MQYVPSSNQLYFGASATWLWSWWHIDIVNSDPVGLGVATIYSICGLGLAIMAVRAAVPTPSPFKSIAGRFLWSIRPRAWVWCWFGLICAVLILGKPLFLWNYGGGRCQYFDWHGNVIVRAAQGDGSFGGCRFLWSVPF